MPSLLVNRGTAPVPAGTTVDPALVQTNGYDFRNNVAGDTYVFLLGADMEGYQVREPIVLYPYTPFILTSTHLYSRTHTVYTPVIHVYTQYTHLTHL